MNSIIWFMFTVLAIIVVQSKRLDPGPQTFIEKTPTEQTHQKRYAAEELIVYLTPNQIKDIQEGKGYLNAEPVDQAESSEDFQEDPRQQQPEQDDILELSPIQLENQASEEEEDDLVPASIPVEESNLEQNEEEPQFSWTYSPQEQKFIPSQEELDAYLRYYPETETQSEAVQLEPEESEEETEELQPEVQQQQKFRLVPYEAATEKTAPSTTEAPQEQTIRERWLRLLEQNRAQFRRPIATQQKTTTTTTTEEPHAEPETSLAQWLFSARYNDQKKAIENEKERSKNVLDIQKALIRGEARTNKSPLVIRKKENIRKYPQSPIIKHVKVPTPVLIPIPEPFEVKVPHPFPVPFQIYKQISEPAAKAKTTGTKKSKGPARSADEKSKNSSAKTTATTAENISVVEKRVGADAKKEVSIEVPTRQRGQPERITIIRHSWEK